MFITPCLFNSSNILTNSFLTPVCPAFWLASKRSNLSINALGSFGRIVRPVPLVEGVGSSCRFFLPFPPFPPFPVGLGLISNQIGSIMFFHLGPC